MTFATCRPWMNRSSASKRSAIDQVRALYHGYLGADHGEVVVVGDFESSEILPVLSKTFEDWKSDKPYALIERPYQPDHEPRRDAVSTPDKENAIYLAGLLMPMRDDDPDYPAMVMGNFVLGGGRSLVTHRRSPAPEGGPLVHRDVDVASQPARTSFQLHGHGDL